MIGECRDEFGRPDADRVRSHLLTVEVGIRPVEYLSGLQASTIGLDASRTAQPHFGTFNVIARDPNFSPYLYAVFQSGIGAASTAAFGQPTWSAQLKWAGPLFHAPALAKHRQP